MDVGDDKEEENLGGRNYRKMSWKRCKLLTKNITEEEKINNEGGGGQKCDKDEKGDKSYHEENREDKYMDQGDCENKKCWEETNSSDDDSEYKTEDQEEENECYSTTT